MSFLAIHDFAQPTASKQSYDRYTIKAAPAVSHKEIVKKLQEAQDVAPEELAKFARLKLKIEDICEAPDLKKITDLLKELPK
jgi:hypothetical protein